MLLLTGHQDGRCRVLDPAKKYKAIFEAESYEEARSWLLEDEYERVEGRLEYSEV